MQKILPNLWYDKEAEAAVKFYTSIFEDSSIVDRQDYKEAGPLPKGTLLSLTFKIKNLEIVAINAGKEYQFTPAISMFVNCTSKEEIDHLYENLLKDGMVMMPLDSYPFSEKFTWVQDKFGVSWQISIAEYDEIIPFLMFVNDKTGMAKPAMEFYQDLFKNSQQLSLIPHPEDQHNTDAIVQLGILEIEGMKFRFSDSTIKHDFNFTSAISFLVKCKDQEEIDQLWSALSDGGQEMMCGWITDKFGVTWQIVPQNLLEMLKDEKRGAEIAKVMYGMKKINLDKLEKIYSED